MCDNEGVDLSGIAPLPVRYAGSQPLMQGGRPMAGLFWFAVSKLPIPVPVA